MASVVTTQRTTDPCGWPREDIFAIASQFAEITHFGIGDDIEALVARSGGDIVHVDPRFDARTATGTLEVRKDDGFTIYLPYFSSKARDRFTIAHELGHLVLHYYSRAGDVAEVERFDRDGADLAEVEANWFAAALLMPEDDFREAFTELNGDLNEIAARYGVSYAAAEVRKLTLGLETETESHHE